jgi:hypothetical protein
MTKYKDLTFKKSLIFGQKTMLSGDWIRFEASKSLFLVDLAMEFVPKSLRYFMNLADGYGFPGYFPGGYDWSGIRDSSKDALAKMQEVAIGILETIPEKKFTKIGLNRSQLLKGGR